MANGEGVHATYRERARKGGDVLWHVTIKGQKELSEGIPLHMSLKVFENKHEMDVEEIKEKVKEFNIQTPNPENLKFETTIFTSERDGNKYYMLTIHGTDKAYEDFYDSLKHCGTVYKAFMPHVTIDKDLYDKINKDGLTPDEVKFEHLTIEYGAGNTIYEFHSMNKSMDFPSMKETILLNYDLNVNHGRAVLLTSSFFKNYLDDNVGLAEEILLKHEDRVRHHFHGDQKSIDFALENGIKQTYEWLRKK
jgi:hypothetical protein